MDQRLIDLYHDYAHVHFDRRVFLEKAARIVGSVSAAAALLPLLAPDDAKAAMVPADDQRVTASRVTFKGVTGDVKGYLAKPKAEGKHGAVVVVHAVGGISPHIEDIARRLAVDGFIALSVDFLSPLGGTPVPRNPEVAALTRSLKPEETTGNAVAAANYLRSLPESNGKVGSVGFCWGGGVVNRLAVADPMLKESGHARPLLRGGAEEGRRPVRDALLSGRAARVQRRYRPALQRRCREARLEPHHGGVQGAPRLSHSFVMEKGCAAQVRPFSFDTRRGFILYICYITVYLCKISTPLSPHFQTPRVGRSWRGLPWARRASWSWQRRSRSPSRPSRGT